LSFFVPEVLNIFATAGAALQVLVDWKKIARGDARAPEITVERAGAKYY